MRRLLIICLLIITSASITIAAGNWRAAQSKFKAFERENANLRQLTPRETRNIVAAICKADEDERKDIARDAGKRAKDKVAAKYSTLQTLKDNALRALDDVLADRSLSSHHRDAREHKAKVTRHFASTRVALQGRCIQETGQAKQRLREVRALR